MGSSPQILASMAKAESGFTLDAVSPDNAQGILQFLPTTANWMGVDPSNQHQRSMVLLATSEPNLRSSTTWRWQSPHTTRLRAVSRYGGIPPYAETEAYVEKVLRYAGWEEAASKSEMV